MAAALVRKDIRRPKKMDRQTDEATKRLTGAVSPTIKLGPRQNSVRGSVKTPESGTLRWSLVRSNHR